VTELVAAAESGEAVPSTVVDAVLARVGRLDAVEQAALEQLSVVPSEMELPLARAVLGNLRVLEGAERSGLVEMRAGVVAFRHELSRRAVEASMPVGVRMQANARVLAALLTGPDPDLARVVHHAVAAGDEAAVVAHAPAAARAAGRLGAHAQEAALQEQALRHGHLLDPAEEAALWRERTATLFSLDRMPEALDAGRRAVAQNEGEPGPLGEALVALALVYWALVRPMEGLAAAERAVRVLEPGGDSPQLAYALAYLGGLQGTVDRDAESQRSGEAALAVARRLDAPHLVALARIARGTARLKQGDPGGVDDLAAGIAGAAAVSAHVFAMTGYVLLVQDLWNAGRYDEAERWMAEASAYAQERDLQVYLDHVTAYRFRSLAVRGEWESAEAGLRRLLRTDESGTVRQCLPELSRLVVRLGTDDAQAVLDRALDFARRAHNRYEVGPVAMARIELAWLTGRPDDADEAVRLLEHVLWIDAAAEHGGGPQADTAVPGVERARADLLRWLRRLGRPAAAFPGCPPEYAAGLSGDWRAAAAGFAAQGARYEQALELADSGETAPMLEALRMLDELGARPAAALLRKRLRNRGVSQVPRGPSPTTRANPAGLTERQVEILQLLAAERTNAEIAARLVLSVRTVDHHVSAVLQKLGVGSRREAAEAATRLGLG
jgi:DNA-binding CsgD family transcriptional regulator/tetratricopeptide (TPR) repeat protein